jgi:hypothetical protein
MAMTKRKKPVAKPGATLWTPWGLQGRAERNAQMLAIRKLVKRVAVLDRRNALRLNED